MSGQAESPYNELIGKQVVLDTQGPLVILGTLQRVTSDCFVLSDADVHDCTEGHSGKELYVINARKFGLRSNREKAYVRRDEVVSVSPLESVITD